MEARKQSKSNRRSKFFVKMNAAIKPYIMLSKNQEIFKYWKYCTPEAPLKSSSRSQIPEYKGRENLKITL